MKLIACVLGALLAATSLQAETGYRAWLRYAPLDAGQTARYHRVLPAVVVSLTETPISANTRDELVRGVRGMLGRTLREESSIPTSEGAIVLGTLAELRRRAPEFHLEAKLARDAYWLKTIRAGGNTYTIVAAQNPRGVLYGVFGLLRKIALGEPVANLDEKHTPYAPVRWVNQWDNLNGSIERGYGGRSIFWNDGHVRRDLSRVSAYGRLLASLGIKDARLTTSMPIHACLPPNSSRRSRASPRPFAPGACAWRFRWIWRVPKPWAGSTPSTRSIREFGRGGSSAWTRCTRRFPTLGAW